MEMRGPGYRCPERPQYVRAKIRGSFQSPGDTHKPSKGDGDDDGERERTSASGGMSALRVVARKSSQSSSASGVCYLYTSCIIPGCDLGILWATRRP